MSIINSGTSAINDAKAFLENPFKKKVTNPYPKPDFPKGLLIREYDNGKPVKEIDWVKLLGNMAPYQPFQFGGTQRIVKEYYPGNSEPVVQVLGEEESNLVIKGRFKDKRYKDLRYRGVATEVQKQLDAIRIRGKLLELKMGEWRRFAFLEKTDFAMKTLADIDYTLEFSVIGFNPPQNYQIVKITNEVPYKINKSLIAAATNWQEDFGSTFPDTMPQSLSDIINGFVSDVAEVISTVTGFVDSVLTQVEDVTKAMNRAIGLIRYAQISLFRFKERIGRLNVNNHVFVAMNLGKYQYRNEVVARTQSRLHIANAQKGANDLMTTLESMRAKFAELSASVPLARYRTVEGDTLQKIAIKYYNDSGKWKNIYDHNNLTSTELIKGLFLEIPKE